MDIRLLEKNDIGEAKSLWKSAFGDSDEFIDAYFKNKILLGNSIAMFDNGLVSVVHMIPFKIRVQGKAFDSAYIAGAATANHKRKQGLMKKLLLESLGLMRERGIAITHLYPFLHRFYEQFGWATYSYVDKKKVTTGKTSKEAVETKDVNLLHALYQNMTRNMDGCVIRSSKEWKWRMDELFADGGRVTVLNKDDEPVCYMMYYEQDGKADVIETVYEKPEYADRLAEHLASQYSEVRYNLVSQNQSGEAHGMARIVDAERLLSEVGVQDLLEKINVTDSFAAWNNTGSGSFNINAGQLARIVQMGAKRAYEDTGISFPDELNIGLKTSSTCIFEEY